MSFLAMEQKKGDPDHLDGRLTVYAAIDIDPAELASTKHPVASLVQNGFLVAQGNFRDQNSLKDFLKSEMGLSLEEGIEQLLDKVDGIEAALDPAKLREKLENMDEIEDFIPTPAKIVSFPSESDILEQEGDVFYGGIFKKIGNAILCVNAFPILYQARFKEQVMDSVRSEIEQLISQIESPDVLSPSPAGSEIEQKIVRDYIPSLLYHRNDHKEFDGAEQNLRRFLEGYDLKKDIDAVVNILRLPQELTKRHFRLLELYAHKIAEITRENFSEAEKTRTSIERLEKELLR